MKRRDRGLRTPAKKFHGVISDQIIKTGANKNTTFFVKDDIVA